MSAPTSAELSPAGPRRQQRGIQLPQLLLSLLVVAVFALLAVWWQANTTSRTPVVALANNIEKGEPIQSSDLTEIFISSDVPARVVPAEQRQVFVGSRPVADLAAGTLITPDMFVAGAELAPGQAFAGLILDGTRAPGGIVAGDRVQILVPRATGDAEIVASDARVESARSSGDEVRLLLRLRLDDAQRVQSLADQVVVIEVDGSGLADWEVEPPA